MAQFFKKTYLHITMGSTGEATDQDMLSLDCHPIQPRLLGNVGLNLAFGLFWSSDCMLET